MTRIPHRYNSYGCMCQVPYPEYESYGTGGVMLTTQSSSLRRLLDLGNDSMCYHRLFEVAEEPYTNFTVTRTLKAFYETCAGYNLRYCPFTGFVKHNGNYFSHIVKDVAILICFLATNFVVFITIITKTIVDMFFLLLMTKQWISRTFFTHPDMVDENCWSTSPAHPYQSYPLQLPDKYSRVLTEIDSRATTQSTLSFI